MNAEAITREIRVLHCPYCPSQVLGPTGTGKRRYRIAHTETCWAWQIYQKRLPGYTAIPSGLLVRGDEELPPGTTHLLANRPLPPCGAVVTHRGPYKRRPPL